MEFTVRFAHLKTPPPLNIGDKITSGQFIGIMGNTGQSTGEHLHLDVVEGINATEYTLNDIEKGNPAANPRQAALFIDRDLFKGAFVITTGYADPTYLRLYRKLHSGFDVVPTREKNKMIYWNRSMVGTVIAVVFNPRSYGHCLHVAYKI